MPTAKLRHWVRAGALAIDGHEIGLAFSNTFFPQIVKIHFRKHLTLAFGITQAGACLGAFFSPPLILWIFRSYGTSGAFLIIGVIVLNSLPIVLILNILSPNKLYNKSGDSMKSKKCSEGHLEMGVTTTVNCSEGEDNNITNNVCGKKERDVKTTAGNANSERRNSLENKAVAALVLNRPTYDHTEVVPGRADCVTLNTADELTMCNLSMNETGSETAKDRMDFVFAECGMISELKSKSTVQEKELKVATDEKINEIQYDFKEESVPSKLMPINNERNLLKSNDCIHSKTGYKLKSEINNKSILKHRVGDVKDCYPSRNSGSNTPPYSSVSNVPASSYLLDQERTQQQITIENGEIIPTSFNALNARSLESNEPSNQDINQKEVLKIAKKPTTGTTNAKKSLKNFLDVTFWIVIITQSLYVFVLVIFWTTIIDFSRDKNIDRSKEVYLLMALPIAEIIGRLGLGWITDNEYLTRISFSILSFIVMGCSCSLVAWAQEFIVVMASIFMFGVISSGLITVFPMIIFEFFDSSNHTMGQASKYCLFGPLSFLNGPLIGNKNSVIF
ncbi:hypothetical protein AVEN_29998-1 [Araneus ventricosus]|uniref:Major facilitator superfamily (MFS) profile domain-containing protein n=1 Tax=Araneus ventricosus TaxID=182803 RepID=A0A4Y2VSY7_ARAVE|nr:hypothetical protein AVEN_29998-1 [Araneus ventricosus]